MSGSAHVGWIVAFAAGIISFLSPCVLPLVPGYVSFISGVSLEALSARSSEHTARVLRQSLVFVLGFSLAFVLLGATASVAGQFILRNRYTFNLLAGLFVIVMGLHLMGWLRIPTLNMERRIQVTDRPRSPLGALLVGMAFAFGWTPCVGPVLASILLYASTAGTVREGALLLFIYSLGLGVPFVVTGVAFTRAVGVFRWVRRFQRPLEVASGAVLAGIGVLLVTNKIFYLSVVTQQLFLLLGIDATKFL
jgi:cytochrome c-type biogenesis protein